MRVMASTDMEIDREELSEESCPFCGARTEKLYQEGELIAQRCIQCAYANWLG